MVVVYPIGTRVFFAVFRGLWVPVLPTKKGACEIRAWFGFAAAGHPDHLLPYAGPAEFGDPPGRPSERLTRPGSARGSPNFLGTFGPALAIWLWVKTNGIPF